MCFVLVRSSLLLRVSDRLCAFCPPLRPGLSSRLVQPLFLCPVGLSSAGPSGLVRRLHLLVSLLDPVYRLCLRYFPLLLSCCSSTVRRPFFDLPFHRSSLSSFCPCVCPDIVFAVRRISVQPGRFCRCLGTLRALSDRWLSGTQADVLPLRSRCPTTFVAPTASSTTFGAVRPSIRCPTIRFIPDVVPAVRFLRPAVFCPAHSGRFSSSVRPLVRPHIHPYQFLFFVSFPVPVRLPRIGSVLVQLYSV